MPFMTCRYRGGQADYFYVKGSLEVWFSTSPLEQHESVGGLLSERLRFFETQVESLASQDFVSKLGNFLEILHLNNVLLVEVDGACVFPDASNVGQQHDNLDLAIERTQTYLYSTNREPDRVALKVVGNSGELHVLLDAIYSKQHAYGGCGFMVNVVGVPIEFTKSMPLVDMGSWTKLTATFSPVDSNIGRQYLQKIGSVLDDYALKIELIFSVTKTKISTSESGVPPQEYSTSQ